MEIVETAGWEPRGRWNGKYYHPVAGAYITRHPFRSRQGLALTSDARNHGRMEQAGFTRVLVPLLGWLGAKTANVSHKYRSYLCFMTLRMPGELWKSCESERNTAIDIDSQILTDVPCNPWSSLFTFLLFIFVLTHFQVFSLLVNSNPLRTFVIYFLHWLLFFYISVICIPEGSLDFCKFLFH